MPKQECYDVVDFKQECKDVKKKFTTYTKKKTCHKTYEKSCKGYGH